MEILSTNFGGSDVTKLSQQLWKIDAIAVRSVEPGFPDSWKGVPKTTTMLHRNGTHLRVVVVAAGQENHNLVPGPIQVLSGTEIRDIGQAGAHPRPAGSTITILAMTWGPHVIGADVHFAYVYACHLSGAKVRFTNEGFGRGVDTLPGVPKSGVIFYTVDGDDKTIKQLAGHEGVHVGF